MDISTRHFRCFLTVARLKSFTQAASELNVSQPALSVTIQRLEELLGAQLFDRNRKKVNLTSVGEEFLGVANRLLGDFENSIDGVRVFFHELWRLFWPNIQDLNLCSMTHLTSRSEIWSPLAMSTLVWVTAKPKMAATTTK